MQVRNSYHKSKEMKKTRAKSWISSFHTEEKITASKCRIQDTVYDTWDELTRWLSDIINFISIPSFLISGLLICTQFCDHCSSAIFASAQQYLLLEWKWKGCHPSILNSSYEWNQTLLFPPFKHSLTSLNSDIFPLIFHFLQALVQICA